MHINTLVKWYEYVSASLLVQSVSFKNGYTGVSHTHTLFLR